MDPASLKDDDLAGRMGLQLKELNKVMVVLENDRLIKVCVWLLLVHALVLTDAVTAKTS